mmetsp:Transcript_12426/g.36081  ORF Transcript_12426/g.36081 Transcript_12426/m.36081 type:complete len:432 (-) Transcript_12426:1-1296(-)
MIEIICCKRIRLRLLCQRVIFFVLFIFLALLIVSKVLTSKSRMPVPSLYVDSDDISSSIDGDSSIVIIGAGAAGLYAAYTLEYLGYTNYHILEASDRIGGRMRETVDFIPDRPIDLGAEWIHVDSKILEDLILFDDDTSSPPPRTINYQPQTYGFRNSAFGTFRFNIIKHFYAETKFYNSTWFSYFRDSILTRIPPSKIQLNTIVTNIQYNNNDLVTITSKSSSSDAKTTTTCNRVIIAVPATVLQDEDAMITFDPPLTNEMTNAINAVDLQDGVKLFFEFERKFYHDQFFVASMWETAFGDYSVTYFDGLFRKDSAYHMVTVLDVGENSLVDLDDDEIVEHFLDELDDMYDGKARKHYRNHVVMNWSKEPYIHGTWTEGGVSFDKLSKPIGNKLFLAGEYVHEEFSTVHAAALSGRRAAEAALQSMMDGS